MRLFVPDLYRNFAIGFAVGAAMIAGATVDQWGNWVGSPARAAETAAPQQPSADYFIAAGPVAAQ